MGAEQYRITIKPERLLEPYVERRMVGGRSLTLMVIHYTAALNFWRVNHPVGCIPHAVYESSKLVTLDIHTTRSSWLRRFAIRAALLNPVFVA
jgi:hypothetical protein